MNITYFRSILNSPMLNRSKKMSTKSSLEGIEISADALNELTEEDELEEYSGTETSQAMTSSNRVYHNLETFQRKKLKQKVINSNYKCIQRTMPKNIKTGQGNWHQK